MKKVDIVQIAPDDLHFDFRNPRIAEFEISNKAPEEEILKILWDVMGAEEIVLSIISSGFFSHEPLIAINEDGKNVVIEGNRRLAAIKCILNPAMAEKAGSNKNIVSAKKDVKDDLKTVPVIFVADRKEAWRYIGFKHINGPAKWGSYAKAQYISEIHKDYGISLGTIAYQIGDTHRTVQKLYQGLQVIEQAERAKIFDRRDIKAGRLYFSHLYTAINYEGFKDYLGLWDIDEETTDPVPKDKLNNLSNVLTWLYGSKKREIEPVIKSQNPDVRLLESVIKSDEAVSALDKGYPLSYAYDVSRPKDVTFTETINEVKRNMQKALSTQTEGYDGSNESLLRSAGTIAKMADELYSLMLAKFDSYNGNQPPRRRFTE